jgi:hypothetical protein
MLMGPRRLQELSQADSGLESLAAIQGRDIKHCYFPASDLQLERKTVC